MTTIKVLLAALFICGSSALFVNLEKLTTSSHSLQDNSKAATDARGSLKFIVKNAVDAPVANALITIATRKSSDEPAAFTITKVTDKFGQATFEGLKRGTYYYKMRFQSRYRVNRAGVTNVTPDGAEMVIITIPSQPQNEDMR